MGLEQSSKNHVATNQNFTRHLFFSVQGLHRHLYNEGETQGPAILYEVLAKQGLYKEGIEYPSLIPSSSDIEQFIILTS